MYQQEQKKMWTSIFYRDNLTKQTTTIIYLPLENAYKKLAAHLVSDM